MFSRNLLTNLSWNIRTFGLRDWLAFFPSYIFAHSVRNINTRFGSNVSTRLSRHVSALFLWYISTYLLRDIITSSTWNILTDGCWAINAILHRDILTDFILYLPLNNFDAMFLRNVTTNFRGLVFANFFIMNFATYL